MPKYHEAYTEYATTVDEILCSGFASYQVGSVDELGFYAIVSFDDPKNPDVEIAGIYYETTQGFKYFFVFKNQNDLLDKWSHVEDHYYHYYRRNENNV